MLKPLLTILFALGIIFSAISQITQQQANPIDSALVAEYLDEGNFHTQNYHGVTFPPGGYWMWDAGCGIYMDIEDYFLAWSHTGMVADTLAACIDTMPCQAYRLFNLQTMSNTTAYHDSVEAWLGSLGIPVGINLITHQKLKIFPNPIANNSYVHITIPAKGKFELRIQTLDGKTLDVVIGSTLYKQFVDINVQHLHKGTYVFSLIIAGKQFSALVIKN